ncbi:retrovirus-related Pol polyprotein from transposon TNT 1-94 [Trichonephila clavipes]|nr:retrovirus-related Pol polyprotein from transposon TNT 1-94 [Trichonephila clavipes]
MRAKMGIMMGYAQRTKGYRIWLIDENKLVETINVRFDENKRGINFRQKVNSNLGYNLNLPDYYDDEDDFDRVKDSLTSRLVSKTSTEMPSTSEKPDVSSDNHSLIPCTEVKWIRNIGRKVTGSNVYYSIEGEITRLKSFNEIERYCKRHNIEYDPSLFNFRKDNTESQGFSDLSEQQEALMVEVTIPNCYKQAIRSRDASKWHDAMDKEINVMKERKVWDLVDHPDNIKILENRWVYTIKYDENNKIVRYKARLVARGNTQLRGESFDEVFQEYKLELSKVKSLKLRCYSDSDFATNRDDRVSMGGFITFIDETPISSRTFKQKSVSLSTMEAEYVSLTEAAKEFIWLKNVIDNKSLNLELSENVMFCDNQAAISFSKSPVENYRTKHIDVRYHFLRNLIYDKGEDGMNNEMKLIEEIAEYCKRNENRINSEILQDKNINFVVQNSNIPVVTNETELTALLQEHEDSSGSGSTIDTSPKSHPSPNRMSSSQTFPGDPVRFPDWSPKNRFQVCRVILDAEMNSQDNSSSSASSTKGDSTNQSEESVFFPASPIESGYDSNSSSPFTSKENANEAEVKKAYIRHQDSIAILKQHGRISSNPAVDVEDQQIHEDDETNDSEEEAGDVGISDEGKSSQRENPQSALMARRASGGKVVKKLTFLLPDDYTEHMNGMKTNRRMSTPAVATQKLVQQKHKAMNLKLGRQLEGLDLKSSVPLSPTRLREGLIFPEPFETKIAIGEGS